MTNQKDSNLEAWEAPPGKTAHRLRDGAIIGLLLAMLLVVQLPLIWMILTAFKTKGTAFRLAFIPSRVERMPSADTPPIPVVQITPDQFVFHLEVRNATASSVDVNLEYAPEGATQTKPMRRVLDGLWVATIPLSQRGEYRWSFSYDGGPPQKDPGDPRRDDGNAYTWMDINPPARTNAGANVTTPEFFAYRLEDELRVAITLPEGFIGASAETDRGQVELFTADRAGRVYFAETKGFPAETFRIRYERTFGDALGTMYTTQNFKDIFASEDFQFGTYAKNSFLVAFGAAFLTVLICTLAGYAFSVKHFHHRDRLFWLLFASMLVPGMIFMVPQFRITVGLGWMNTWQGLVIPHLGNVFGLFLLRQYIGQIPEDLFSAAKIDGASEIQVFQNIVIPLAAPIMVTLFLLTFVTQWSNFLWQLITNTGNSPWMTLPVGLQRFRGQFGTDWEKIMAGACFSIVPIAVLFLMAQKYFIEGMTAGAVKE
ncbi:MAG: ABC transporter permease subunit [Candidatus Sumerlaeia bacterium]|nr:ABC transporter permease subunit [Candidatus Sumerlaeia bacterium]